jgi:dTDP-4-dehydrorhamnose 3,5-epimerase
MQFRTTKLDGPWLIGLQPALDGRGYFARTFCGEEFAARGLEIHFPQHSISYSAQKGTLRGMHYQRRPHAEVKLLRCLRGTIWDVIVDIRPKSPTFRCWQGFELSDSNQLQLYVPKGFAHGFQTLTENAEVSYLISESYAPSAASGIRYNDPNLGIPWPLSVSAISDKDLSWPDFVEENYVSLND